MCLFLSFSCSVFVCALFNMFDDGLLSYISASPKIFKFLGISIVYRVVILVPLSKCLDLILS